jgi:hypothetical protein
VNDLVRDDGAAEPPTLLWGAAAIAQFLNTTEHAVYHLVEDKRIPVLHVGKRIAARPQTLLAWIAEQERLAMQGDAA